MESIHALPLGHVEPPTGEVVASLPTPRITPRLEFLGNFAADTCHALRDAGAFHFCPLMLNDRAAS